jgi:hypothetical protein
MINKIKKLLITAAAGLMFATPALAPAIAHADVPNCEGIQNCLDVGSCQTDPTNCDNNGDAGSRVQNLIKLVINVVSLIVGVVAVIMIIFGGFKYITSGGEGSNVSGAKNTILYAIIGLVIVALAQVIVRFVLQKTTQ